MSGEKTTPKRIYLIEREPRDEHDPGDEHLVRAANRAAALAHVARRTLKARVASQDDLVRCLTVLGLEVEEAGTDAEDPPELDAPQPQGGPVGPVGPMQAALIS